MHLAHSSRTCTDSLTSIATQRSTTTWGGSGCTFRRSGISFTNLVIPPGRIQPCERAAGARRGWKAGTEVSKGRPHSRTMRNPAPPPQDTTIPFRGVFVDSLEFPKARDRNHHLHLRAGKEGGTERTCGQCRQQRRRRKALAAGSPARASSFCVVATDSSTRRALLPTKVLCVSLGAHTTRAQAARANTGPRFASGALVLVPSPPRTGSPTARNTRGRARIVSHAAARARDRTQARACGGASRDRP